MDAVDIIDENDLHDSSEETESDRSVPNNSPLFVTPELIPNSSDFSFASPVDVSAVRRALLFNSSHPHPQVSEPMHEGTDSHPTFPQYDALPRDDETDPNVPFACPLDYTSAYYNAYDCDWPTQGYRVSETTCN